MSQPGYEDVMAQLDALIGPIEGGGSKARRRLQILRVATELFSRQGYRKTSMDEVAAGAGVAKGTLYTYFSNKNELLISAIALEKRERMGTMAEILDPTRPAEERLRQWMVTLLLLPSRMPLTSALLRGDQEMAAVMADMPAALNQQIDKNRDDYLCALIDEVARPHAFTMSELRDRAAVLSGIAFLSTHLQAEHVRGGLSMERYAELLADTLLAGLRGGRASDEAIVDRPADEPEHERRKG
ncbi:TetR/AcrR family transcriptional regulator [Paraliomyxa miuraensis]|uniref:TetR/AcrR family transcriptional regulator n=1 Tax=Paraliomyxa miuraensis TaxID=376150 RepID=UPI002258A0E6|nr:TetR/AcrR family transcriptional regulator [Paraliomyxa miuraensis]MCX4247096.1 TetR/AcrR family transcriptional regulator [Paraliomyxa miuraensis]